MKKKVIKRNGNLVTYYFRSYLGFLPIGRKVRHEEFENLLDGTVWYTRYSADGKQVAEEGKYSDREKSIKIGLWTSRNIDKNENISELDVFFDRLGKKVFEIQQRYDSDNRRNYILSERFFHNDYVLTFSFNVNGCIVKKEKKLKNKMDIETVLYDEHGCLFEKSSIRSLPLRFKEQSFQQVNRYQNGRLVYSVFIPQNLKDVSIKTYFNADSSVSHYDYLEKNHLLMRTNKAEELHRFLVSHQKHCKKDDKTRSHILHELSKLPTLTQKKSWLRLLLDCQGYER